MTWVSPRIDHLFRGVLCSADPFAQGGRHGPQAGDIMFTKSTDHGATSTPAVQISGGVWADKPWDAVSANGSDVYAMWATHGNLYAVDSHDGGSTWTAPLQVTSESGIHYYPNGGAVLPNGTAVMVASEYPESGNNTKKAGPIPIVLVHLRLLEGPGGRSSCGGPSGPIL